MWVYKSCWNSKKEILTNKEKCNNILESRHMGAFLEFNHDYPDPWLWLGQRRSIKIKNNKDCKKTQNFIILTTFWPLSKSIQRNILHTLILFY